MECKLYALGNQIGYCSTNTGSPLNKILIQKQADCQVKPNFALTQYLYRCISMRNLSPTLTKVLLICGAMGRPIKASWLSSSKSAPIRNSSFCQIVAFIFTHVACTHQRFMQKRVCLFCSIIGNWDQGGRGGGPNNTEQKLFYI